MSYFRSKFISVAIFLLSGVAVAQQVPMFSQYIMNGFLINPSLAGRDGYTSVNLTAREQWMGMSGAPSTFAASFQTSLLKDSYMSKSQKVRKKVNKPTKGSNVGVGANLFTDNNGIMKRTGIQAAYAYHIRMGSMTKGTPNNLSFGLALVAYQYVINTKDLHYSYNDDPYFTNYDKSVFITDFNFGMNYATSKFYAGFAMTNILRGSLIFGDASDDKRVELGHYFLTGGLNLPINKEWTIKPSAFIKSSDLLFQAIQLDLTSRVYYKDSYWAGLSYRTNDAIIMMLGLKYDKYYFAYAFDFSLTDIRVQSAGTMEITLAVKFGESSRRYRWLNSF
jgi:type IX secretion system PorP/SprF family membrane protein